MLKKMKLFYLLLFVVALGGCDKNNKSESATYKNVVYSIDFDLSDGDLYFKGSYTDAAGNSIAVDQPLPFKKTITQLSLSTPCQFSGYLYGEGIKELVGTISMVVTGHPGDRVIANKEQEVRYLSNSGHVYTPEELKTKTEFSFKE